MTVHFILILLWWRKDPLYLPFPPNPLAPRTLLVTFFTDTMVDPRLKLGQTAPKTAGIASKPIFAQKKYIF